MSDMGMMATESIFAPASVAISGTTRLVPILAHPVDHVIAPRLYNPAFEAACLDWCLVPMGVAPANFEATVAMLAHVANVQGLHITPPHKRAAYALCARLGDEARRTGVVNTMRLEADGSWSGESFDGFGFVSAADAHGLLRGASPKQIVLVGCGGAGTAIAHALADLGAGPIALFDTDSARAWELAGAVGGAARAVDAAALPGLLAQAALVVHATPLGLHAGEPLPFDPALLRPDAGVFDIIAARDTELMAACRARGLHVVGGRAMVVHQARAQIAFWRGAPDARAVS